MSTFTRIFTIVKEKKFESECAENAFICKNILALQKCKAEVEIIMGVRDE